MGKARLAYISIFRCVPLGERKSSEMMRACRNNSAVRCLANDLLSGSLMAMCHSPSTHTSSSWFLKPHVLDETRMSIEETLRSQKEHREARRNAFVTWQNGQIEKGAAHRLLRLARVTESNKRHHYHRQGGRLIPVTKA